ncbi:hypothetical protein AB0J74_16110 [Asanoa sp. NPDC049573]|uniref:AbiTii domain-containing protein n=1 Tax=Asanoa sp. NPDC049573 TaxID=3155396 RepID=UPI00341EB044
MTLLAEVIDGAAGPADVSTLLRKLKVVASRTRSTKLADWVAKELEGYKNEDILPEYRGPVETIVLGHFVGMGNRQAQNVPIPPSTFPSDMRESSLFMLRIFHPVAQIADMAERDSVEFAWPADAMRYYNYGTATGIIHRVLQDDMALMTAHRPIMRQVWVGVLDAVRNRILDLALELERVAPEAGQGDATASAREKAAAVANTFNFYGTSNVAVGSTDFEQSVNVERGDERSLFEALRALGVMDSAISELRAALAADRSEAGTAPQREPGSRVRGWLAQASTQFGSGAAANLVAEAVKAFFG